MEISREQEQGTRREAGKLGISRLVLHAEICKENERSIQKHKKRTLLVKVVCQDF